MFSYCFSISTAGKEFLCNANSDNGSTLIFSLPNEMIAEEELKGDSKEESSVLKIANPEDDGFSEVRVSSVFPPIWHCIWVK